METIIIGDLHGRNIWQQIVQKHPGANFIFLGDYFDSKEGITGPQQVDNFKELLQLRAMQPHRITLLTGNHDYHYLPQAGEDYSGYQHLFATDIQEVLLPAVRDGLLQMCTAVGDYLMSHAGFTCTWCLSNGIKPADFLPDDINMLWLMQPEIFGFSPGDDFEVHGDEPEQGPLWVRPNSLLRDGLPQWVQVVGHTQHPSPMVTPGVICMDVLGFCSNYLIINEYGNFQIASLD